MVDDVYSSFTYTISSSGGGDGQKEVYPSVEYFYPDYYSGVTDGCPTVYWGTKNAQKIYISVDGSNAVTSTNAYGQAVVCSPNLSSDGTHTIELLARNAVDDTYSSFGYTTYSSSGSSSSGSSSSGSDYVYEEDTNYLDDCLFYDEETDSWFSICE